MTPHICGACAKSKGRRALAALLRKNPNIPTQRAAKVLQVNRAYLSTIRKEMETAGCVPRRTVDGRTQAVRDRAARAELVATQSRAARGYPIGTIWVW